MLHHLRRKPSAGEAKDLTDFMHGFAAPLHACDGCGLLVRAERRIRSTDSYSEDPNDPDVMRQLLPRYVSAFRNKAPGFRDLLRPHADVLEIGSHLGAFLQVAEEWNWTAIGLDVGADTSDFARAHGFKVRREMAEDTRLPGRSFDAVFMWNCFEQMTEPAPALAAVRKLLRPDGLLVIRVPNGRFYMAARRRNRSQLAWNNLLGFPYLHGYTEEHVSSIARKSGFEFANGFDSELVTMPFPEVTREIRTAECSSSDRAARWSIETTMRSGALTGPWIEMAYRRVEREPLPGRRRADALDRRFLARAA